MGRYQIRKIALPVGIGLILLIAVLMSPAIAHAETVEQLGEPTGYVNDYTNTLSSTEIANLTAICEDLIHENGTEMAIVIIDTLGRTSIEDYAQDLFAAWKIGKLGVDNGVLILVALNDREWRVHTGYGVEGALPDNLARRIMEDNAVPAFRNGDYGGGLIKSAGAIANVLKGERYASTTVTVGLARIFIPVLVIFLVGIFIWLAVRIKCPRCGSRIELKLDRELLESTYSHSGIRKKEYECTVCDHQFARMTVVPMLVEAGSGGSSGWSGWSGGGGWSSSSGGGGGGGSFGGFGGGSSGGGGASGGW